MLDTYGDGRRTKNCVANIGIGDKDNDMGEEYVTSTECVPTYAAYCSRYNLVNVGSFTNDNDMDGVGFLQPSRGSGKR